MEPEGSLPHSQASATCPYPGPAQSSPQFIIIIIEFLTSLLWLGNIHVSWDVVINRIRLGGIICSLKSFLILLLLLLLLLSNFSLLSFGWEIFTYPGM